MGVTSNEYQKLETRAVNECEYVLTNLIAGEMVYFYMKSVGFCFPISLNPTKPSLQRTRFC